ncbi:MAG: SigF/SigG family RNA polymerase sporulation sigma factor [Lachnospiraceae bacterium]|nr:SigF/SigG family RNA polymerase sporulation sigma factor [Lachnospiraceae bacterium]
MEELTVLIERSQAGEKEAREVLIEKNMGLVHHIARRFIGRGCEVDDLLQIGTIGLMKAIDKFDMSFEVKFSTYAVPMISGEIKRFLRDDGLIKVSRSLKENSYKIKRAAERLTQIHGRDPTLNEIAGETGIMTEDIVLALEAGAEVESIYKTVYQSDGNEVFLMDKLADPDKVDKVVNKMLLKQLLSELDESERELIMLRYFHDKTQTEVAGRLGISQVQVSRMEKKILLTMRRKIG